MAHRRHVVTAAEHRHTPEEERRIREAALDTTLANTFPASDPPSSIPNPDEHDAVEHVENTPDRQDEAGSRDANAEQKPQGRKQKPQRREDAEER